LAIKLNGKTVKAKVRATRNPALSDEQYTGTEPQWDTELAEKMDQQEFDHHLRRSFYYYNYHYSQKDTKKHVVEWMTKSEKFTKPQISAFNRSADKAIPMTVHSLVMAHRIGMPFREKDLNFVLKEINEVIANTADEVIVVAGDTQKPYVPTIQDRLNEKTAETIGELEGHYDEFLMDKNYSFKAYDFFVSNNVPQSQLSKYELLYEARKQELSDAQSKTDPQLAEGYKHYKASDFKRIFVFIDKLLEDIEQYRGVKRATKKVRAPRAVSKEKVVNKLKYAKEDKTLKLVSINPVDILGASELWVYNTKTKKLGKYVADSLQGPLSVKGTSVTGFDEHKSICKTLRKPEEKLKEFSKATKIQLRKFLDEIKTTDTKLNGRISTDVILLKAT
jgi:hypothetical protein